MSADFPHIPVMLNECLDALAIRADGAYLDCTLGGGGFYAVGSGIYCAYRDEDFWVLPELLCPGVEAASFGGLETRSRPYLCSDLPFPEGLVWNLSFD